MKKIYAWIVLMASILLVSCQEEMTRTYSTKYPVRAFFTVASYAELLAVINNGGQFGTVRQVGDKVRMSSPSSHNEYNLDAMTKTFSYGLGGLIIGTNYNLELRAYDLACPNCDASLTKRLNIQDNGYAKCPGCEMVYNLNGDGAIYDTGKGLYKSPRGLYRYRIEYNGTTVVLSN